MRKIEERMYDIPEAERPYEKCQMHGPEVLSDVELLAVILRSGNKGMPVLALARNVLALDKTGRGIAGICSMNDKDLESIKGIGQAKAAQIRCVAELSKRIAKSVAKEKIQFSSPKTVAEYYMEQLRHESQEQVLLVLLDARGCMIKDLTMFRGTATASVASPREIFIEALRYEAVNIMLLHNHPSGDPSPSKDDMDLTRRVRTCGSTLGIPLVDHIIIGDCKYMSFREQGLLFC